MKTTFFAISLLTAVLLSATLQAQPLPVPEVTIAATVPTTAEGGTTPGLFTVTRGQGTNLMTVMPSYSLHVFYRISGTASNGIDYQRILNYVVIPMWSNSATIKITPVDDRLVEGDETVTLTLMPSPLNSSQYPYYVGPESTATVAITDNDTVNLPLGVEIWSPTNGSAFTAPASFPIRARIINEGDSVYTVEFFQGSNSIGVVQYDPRIMYFRDPLEIYRSNLPAGNYTFTAVVTDDHGATGVSAPVNITVKEGPTSQPVVTIAATDPHGSEIPVVPPGMGMPQRFDPAVFTVTRSGSTGFPMAVYYSIGGTAQNGVDYESLPGSVTIPTGASSADIVVAPIDDFLVEGTETVVLTVQAPVCIAIYPPPADCYVVGRPNQATAYILDNDTNQPPTEPPVVTIVATDPDATEIAEVPPGMGLAQRYDPGVFTVSRTGNTDRPLTVFYFTGGTAQNGIDYQRLSNYVIIPSGAASADIVVCPIDDNLVERPETVIVQLRPAVLPYADNSGTTSLDGRMPIIWPPPYIVGSPSNAVVTIADDDTVGTNIPPKVQIVRPMDNSFFRAPANILLVASAADLDGSVSTVEFFEGANSLGLGTQTALLSSVMPNGQFCLLWSNVVAGRYVLTAKATDNQGASTVSGPIHVAVLATNLPPITNTIPVVSITAIDPIASEGRFDFPTTVIVQSNILCPTAAGFSANSTWTSLDPSLSRTVYWTNIFCGTNTAAFEVRRCGPTNADLTVYYSIQGTASNGVDYVALPGLVTINAGRRAARIVIVPIDDTLVEGNETVFLSLVLPPDSASGSVAPYRIGTPARAGAIIIDNDYLLPPVTQLRDGSVHVFLPAANGSGYRLESSSDLAHWTSCLTDIATEPGVHYVDPDASSATVRFYRLVPQPVLVPED